MPAAAVVAVGSIAQGVVQSRAAKKAGQTAARGADAAVEEQRRQFDTLLDLTASERTIGNSARNALARLYGLPQFNEGDYNVSKGLNPDGSPTTSLVGDTQLPIAGRTIVPRQGSRTTFDVFYDGNDVGDLVRGGPNGRFIRTGEIPTLVQKTQPPDAPTWMGIPQQTSDSPFAEFAASPDYQFRRNEGIRDIGQQFAARGSGRSGNALRALAEYNSNLASAEFGQRANRLAALAGAGQVANAQAGSAALATGQGVGRSLIDSANARASGVAGQGAAVSDAIGGLAGAFALGQDYYNFGGGKGNTNALARFFRG